MSWHLKWWSIYVLGNALIGALVAASMWLNAYHELLAHMFGVAQGAFMVTMFFVDWRHSAKRRAA